MVVTQTRVVSYDPFGVFELDDLFKDFSQRHTFRQKGKSMGSGVIVAELAAVAPDRDLALLKISGENLPIALPGDSDELRLGF